MCEFILLSLSVAFFFLPASPRPDYVLLENVGDDDESGNYVWKSDLLIELEYN